MSAPINLTGKRFGKLLVRKRGPNNSEGRATWYAECDCGLCPINAIPGKDLRNSHTQSCGCIRRDLLSESRTIDLRGKIFGRLTALEIVGTSPHGNKIWRCKCSCSETSFKDVPSDLLISKHTKSCGCLRPDEGAYNRKDMAGKRYNRLTGVRHLFTNKQKQAIWLFKCDCGRDTRKRAYSVRNGATKSCGCLHSERASTWMSWLIEQGIAGNAGDRPERFEQEPEYANRKSCIYFVEADIGEGSIYDKIGITFGFPSRKAAGKFSEVWWLKRNIPRSVAWSVEQAALQITRESRPKRLSAGWREYGGKTELREGLAIDETCELLEELLTECIDMGWKEFYKRYIQKEKQTIQAPSSQKPNESP